jgi:hypothetical protein
MCRTNCAPPKHWISRVVHKRHHHMQSSMTAKRQPITSTAVYGISSIGHMPSLSPNKVSTLKWRFRSPILGLWLPLSTFNSTPYDAKSMTCRCAYLTKKRTCIRGGNRSDLLPIYLGALKTYSLIIINKCINECTYSKELL